MLTLPTPHGDKLVALLKNPKLPNDDVWRVKRAIQHYSNWVSEMENIRGASVKMVDTMTALLNEYKMHVDIDLIFDSEHDFLYRQKGQLKLDNSIIEEFLPLLVFNALQDTIENLDLSLGPTTTFSSLRFDEGIREARLGGGVYIRSKDQDFAISRTLYVRTSHYENFAESVTLQSNIAYLAAEIKTNLDKTMFQEAAATALDIKSIVPSARYYLLCEWLDMTPINAATTAIDEILILRRAKRLSSNVRSGFASAAGRKARREFYQQHLFENPLSSQTFSRFLAHAVRLISDASEDDVVTRGYF